MTTTNPAARTLLTTPGGQPLTVLRDQPGGQPLVLLRDVADAFAVPYDDALLQHCLPEVRKATLAGQSPMEALAVTLTGAVAAAVLSPHRTAAQALVRWLLKEVPS